MSDNLDHSAGGSKDRYRFLAQLGAELEAIDDPKKLYKTALARLGRHLGAQQGAVALRHPVSGQLSLIPWGGSEVRWDERRIRAFLDLERPDFPENEIMAPLMIGGRAEGVVALRRAAGAFPEGTGRWLARLCRKLAREAELREERRVNRVVDQIKDKTVRELRPKDLFYQVLHGLRALTRYDHSSAMLIAEEDASRLVLHAEQIAWAKRKSERIGRRIKVPPDLRAILQRATAIRTASFPSARDRAAGSRGTAGAAATARGGAGAPDQDPVARLLRWNAKGKAPAEGSVLWAPLVHDGELLGVLKIAALRPGALGAHEADGVRRVLPHVTSVIHNARRALSMEERIIEAEKKNAMADLARAISHDVKNAIGAILPLAQQAREEVLSGRADAATLSQDLQQIEQSAQVCQRIFDGMLQLARSGARPAERAPLGRVLEGSFAVLGNRMKRAGVALEMKIPSDLPEIDVTHGGLEQLFLNLISNAVESMPAGGRIKINARQSGPRLEVRIADTGTGIPPGELKRIHEPFYTTKEGGSGLGLSICRSILWECGGEMTIDSQPGRGTIVTVLLPAAARPAAGVGGPKPAAPEAQP
jgi:signal transduction histidine kinase